MATATREYEQTPTVTGRAARARRQAAQMSHDARVLMSAAGDALEDGVHGAKRAIKSVRRRVDELGDLRDDAIHQVKRHPLEAVGAAFGVGLAIGLAAGWLARRCAAASHQTSAPLEAVL